MRHSITIITAAILSSSVIGCASNKMQERVCANKNGEFYPCPEITIEKSKALPEGDATLFNTNLHFQLLSDYTEQMAAELEKDLTGTELDGQIAVTPFVYLDASLRQTTRLGVELAEFFIHDLEQAGFAVREQRLSENVSLYHGEEFKLPKDFLESELENVDYVLLGTMIPNKIGLVVNARIVSLNNHEVLASSSKVFPRAIFSPI